MKAFTYFDKFKSAQVKNNFESALDGCEALYIGRKPVFKFSDLG